MPLLLPWLPLTPVVLCPPASQAAVELLGERLHSFRLEDNDLHEPNSLNTTFDYHPEMLDDEHDFRSLPDPMELSIGQQQQQQQQPKAQASPMAGSSSKPRQASAATPLFKTPVAGAAAAAAAAAGRRPVTPGSAMNTGGSMASVSASGAGGGRSRTPQRLEELYELGRRRQELRKVLEEESRHIIPAGERQ